MDADIIIAGGGMAGLSLYHQIRSAGCVELRILLIDQEDKQVNDRTWCFWETEPGPFEPLVHRVWDQVRVHGGAGQPLHLPLGDYRYKMIRSLDFYRFIREEMDLDGALIQHQTTVQAILEQEGGALVRTDKGDFSAPVVFDSIHRLPLNAPGRHHLLQHFLGKVIRTERPVFDAGWPDLMHFGIPQQDQCRFIYILPLDAHRALVEFTVFSESLLTMPEYESALQSYLDILIPEGAWQVEETEFGIIPMSDEPAPEFPSPHIIRIGTAGGYTNPATGFTFRNTQKRLAMLIAHYQATGKWQAPTTFWQRRFGLYASVMLNVLQKKRVPAPEVFYDLYRKNPIGRVFRFLDGESSFLEELKLMQSTAIRHFLLASADVLRRRVFP